MNENVNVCITPKGDKPVLHFSQFDNKNVFTVTVLADDGVSAAVLTGLDIEFRLRKTDSHVVTIAPESVADNVITFKTTEQMCACCGQNIATVTLMKDDMIVSTLDILVDIQRDILSGGLTSESDIRNLTTQIEQIVPEVVGDDYYNKQEVDDLLAEHTFDPSNYYNKQDVDGLLADKADSDDVYTKSDVYNKTETDNLLADKANISDVYAKTEVNNLLAAKMDNIGYHGVVNDAAVISFTTDCNAPLDIIKGKIDPNPSGFSALNVTRTGKNRLNYDAWKTVSIASGTAVWENNGVTLTATSNDCFTAMNIPVNARIPVTEGETITLSWEESTNKNGAVYIFPNGTTSGLVSTNNASHKKLSYTATSGVTFITFRFGVANSGNTIAYKNIQIENGSQATAYEPYNGQTATVSFGQSVTIGGVVDLTNGKVTLTDDTEISFTPVTVSSIAGDNNIFLNTGNLTEITYFGNAEDNLIKLIKACQI